MTTALTPEQRIAELVDDYAESRHVNGHHTYSQKTELARKKVTQRIEALEAELAACRKDAERYRWLRDGKLPSPPNGMEYPIPVWSRSGAGIWDVGLDAAIDAALAAQEQK